MTGGEKGFADLVVLVVEDNEVNQKVTCAMLQYFGIAPDIAENGQVAVDLARKKKYDLILMDCQMPVKNGFETTIDIRLSELNDKDLFKTPKNVVIVAMTANTSPDDIHACMDCGMNDFIAKPVELEIITEKLNKWFSDNPA